MCVSGYSLDTPSPPHLARPKALLCKAIGLEVGVWLLNPRTFLRYGLAQYNELVRCTVASAGNDHRLGAQALREIVVVYVYYYSYHDQCYYIYIYGRPPIAVPLIFLGLHKCIYFNPKPSL